MGGTYEDLRVRQSAVDLVCKVYHATKSFPVEEKYGLSSQLRRAAVSAASKSPRERDDPLIANSYRFSVRPEDRSTRFRLNS